MSSNHDYRAPGRSRISLSHLAVAASTYPSKPCGFLPLTLSEPLLKSFRRCAAINTWRLPLDHHRKATLLRSNPPMTICRAWPTTLTVDWHLTSCTSALRVDVDAQLQLSVDPCRPALLASVCQAQSSLLAVTRSRMLFRTALLMPRIKMEGMDEHTSWRPR